MIKHPRKSIVIEDIRFNEEQRMRPVDEKRVNELSTNFQQVGQIQPIIVIESEDNTYDLSAGLHRTKAAKKAGWEKIDAFVIEPTSMNVKQFLVDNELTLEDYAELIEADENFFRNELTKEQRIQHINRRFEIRCKKETKKVLEEVVEKSLANGNLPKTDESAQLVRDIVSGKTELIEEGEDKHKSKVIAAVKRVRNAVRQIGMKGVAEELDITVKRTRDYLTGKVAEKELPSEETQGTDAKKEPDLSLYEKALQSKRKDTLESAILDLEEKQEEEYDRTLAEFEKGLSRLLTQFTKNSRVALEHRAKRFELLDIYNDKKEKDKKGSYREFRKYIQKPPSELSQPKSRWLLDRDTAPLFMFGLKYISSQEISKKVDTWMKEAYPYVPVEPEQLLQTIIKPAIEFNRKMTTFSLNKADLLLIQKKIKELKKDGNPNYFNVALRQDQEIHEVFFSDDSVMKLRTRHMPSNNFLTMYGREFIELCLHFANKQKVKEIELSLNTEDEKFSFTLSDEETRENFSLEVACPKKAEAFFSQTEEKNSLKYFLEN